MASPAHPLVPGLPPRKRRRWWRWGLLLCVIVVAVDVANCPKGSWRPVNGNRYLEVFGAQRAWQWQADRGNAHFLRLRVATQVRGFVDTAELWKESRLALPLAESLAASTGDTIIQIEHVRYPLTRMVPMWINVWTYYHRDSSGWRPSLSLWH